MRSRGTHLTWTIRNEELSNARGLRFSVDRDARPVTCADLLSGWQGNASFRSLFNSLLAECPYSAFRWDTPPVTLLFPSPANSLAQSSQKTQKTPTQEIALAVRRKNDYLARGKSDE